MGKKFCCSRCAEPACYIRKRLKKTQQTAPEKRRKRSSSTRVGCSFQVSYSFVNYKDKEDKSIKVCGSTCYQHSNGCFPSSIQLAIEKRKAGGNTCTIHPASGTAPPATAIAQSADAAPPAPPTANAPLTDLENYPATTAEAIATANAQFAPAPNAPRAIDPSPVVPTDNPYTAEQLVVIESIAEEASSMFCVGATFNSHEEL
ncbi:hypothetical protein IV203_021964 [Nitzschia inconspicua]|uniref:Uncharacterized protein n=1 Tax=Nitzschia inconspicua TaxID=303405 RepID=A0A9K3KIC7_9STRA|nr:hypothetical protein IV203_021964 [Nitzschia inconspicua]